MVMDLGKATVAATLARSASQHKGAAEAAIVVAAEAEGEGKVAAFAEEGEVEAREGAVEAGTGVWTITSARVILAEACSISSTDYGIVCEYDLAPALRT